MRPAALRDAAAIAGLERRCFGDPWSEDSFREAVSSAWSFGLVAEDDDVGLVGYLIAREVAGTGEILNLAVAAPARRRGVARVLLTHGLETLERRGAEEVFLEVRASNRAAQTLYTSAGFKPVGQRDDYYRYPTEDALVFRLPLGGRT